MFGFWSSGEYENLEVLINLMAVVDFDDFILGGRFFENQADFPFSDAIKIEEAG